MKFDFKKLAVVGALALAALDAQAINLDFGTVGGGAGIKFFAATDTFQILNATSGADLGWSFKIAASDGVGDSIGDLGKISGVFLISSITSPAPGYQTANVTGTGTLTIKDHANQLLTGTLVWNTIYTLGSSGGLNNLGGFNITQVTYGGLENDLIALAAGANDQAIAALEFGFVPSRTLTQLTSGTGTRLTSFSGDLTAIPPPPSVPDGGATISLLILGLLALGAGRPKTN